MSSDQSRQAEARHRAEAHWSKRKYRDEDVALKAKDKQHRANVEKIRHLRERRLAKEAADHEPT